MQYFVTVSKVKTLPYNFIIGQKSILCRTNLELDAFLKTEFFSVTQSSGTDSVLGQLLQDFVEIDGVFRNIWVSQSS